MALPWTTVADYALPFLAQGINMVGAGAATRKQYHANKKLAQLQYEQNLKMMDYQNFYNSPAEQRKRMEAAGYNPNMFYSNGTPGNMSSAPQYPDVKAPDYVAAYSDIGTKILQNRLLESQADLTRTKADESGVKQDLMKQQRAVLAANPYLDETYLKSVVTLMESTATMKQQQRNFMVSHGSDLDGSRGMQKMQVELDSLIQRYNLGSKDQEIKAEILKSKEFQNALQDIQLRWMKDGEITPQHIYMGIMLLLQKMM